MRTSSHHISRSIEDSIREGRVSPGETLPAVRALAEEWAVSPATAAAAYRDLRQRGWVTTGGRRGTQVSAGFPSNRRPTAAPSLVGAPVAEDAASTPEETDDPSQPASSLSMPQAQPSYLC